MKRLAACVVLLFVVGCMDVPQWNADGSPKLDASGVQETKKELDLGKVQAGGEAILPLLPPPASGIAMLALNAISGFAALSINKKDGQ